MSFGLTPQGFVPERISDVVADLQAAFRTAFGQNVRLDSQSVNGQLIGVFAERFASLWELAQAVNSAQYPSSAADGALDDLAVLSDIVRAPATYSSVTLLLGGTPASVIAVGSRARDAQGQLWATLAIATIGGGGTISVAAQAVTIGPVPALAGTITTIDTPVAGWTTVTNPLDAIPGQNIESDAHLRERMLLTMRAGGGSALETIRAAILRLPGVTECAGVENATVLTDLEGRPPFSFEMVVRGGVDQQIFDALWLGKPAAAVAYGSTNGTSLDSFGVAQPVGFTRPTNRNIYFIVDYTPNDGFPTQVSPLDATVSVGEYIIRQAMLDYGGSFQDGQDVIPFEFIQHIEEPNIRSLSLRVGFAASPGSTAPLVVSVRERAVFDSTRITFNRI